MVSVVDRHDEVAVDNRQAACRADKPITARKRVGQVEGSDGVGAKDGEGGAQGAERYWGRPCDFCGVAPYDRSMSTNAAQIAYWDQSAGPRWTGSQPEMDRVLAPLGRLALEAAAPAPGERVLDVGCGCGDSILALSELVGSTGHVVGVDVSGPMLARANERADAAGADNVSLFLADAQTHTVDHRVDLVYSRFGVMFFADPAAAFANLRGALRPGGRLAFVCWQSLERNPWMAWPLAVVERHLGPATQAGLGEPGPFAFADADHVRSILGQAGFVDIQVAPVEGPLWLAADLDAAVRLVTESVGMSASMLREATPEVRAAAVAELRAELTSQVGREGVYLGFAVWVVTARGPLAGGSSPQPAL